MGKLLKILGIVVGATVALVAIALIAVLVLVDPNDYREPIQDAVRDQTGRELRIEGEMKLSVFPWLGLELGAVELGNAPGFGERPFARIETAEVRVRLLPLLSREVEVGRIALRGLRLNLARDARGRDNWSDLAGAPADAKRESGAAPASEGGPPIAALAIGGLEVSDAEIGFSDAAAGADYRLSALELTTGAVALDRATPIDLKFKLRSAQPALGADVSLRTGLTPSASLQQFRLEALRLAVQAQGEGLPVKDLALELGGDAALDLAADTATVTGLALKALGVELGGQLDVKALTAAPRVSGRLRVEPFSPRELLKRLGQAAPETADPGVLGKASIDLVLDATTTRAGIQDLRLLLDDSALTGKLAVEDFARQALRFDLALDAINLDRYLPPAAETPPPAPGTAAVGTAQLPMELLRSLDIAGTFRVGKLTASNLRSEKVEATLKAKDGRIRVHPAGAQLYGGRYAGDIGLDATGKVPRYALNERLEGVQVGPLLADLMGKDRVLGTANLAAKLTASGAGPEDIRKTVSGNASFAFTDGMVKGINVARLLREASAKLKGQNLPPSQEADATDFSALTGSVTLTNGVARNDDLDARSPLLRVQGAGTADLAGETMDYRLKVAVVGSLAGQGGQALEELKGLTIPLRIHGTFTEPRFRVDLEQVIKAEAAAKLKAKEEAIKQEQKQKVEEKKEELKQKLDDKLKGLFKR